LKYTEKLKTNCLWNRGVTVLLAGWVICAEVRWVIHAGLPFGQSAGVRTADSPLGENDFSTDFKLNANSSILLHCKQAARPHQAHTNKKIPAAKSMCSYQHQIK
jgi:hypothetical protein